MAAEKNLFPLGESITVPLLVDPEITAATVDLTNCDRELIHIPGCIQPHGVLLALQEPQLTIVQVSCNTEDFLGIPAAALLGRSLVDLLAAEDLQMIQSCLDKDFENANPLKITYPVQDKISRFDGILHRHDGLLFLELEPSQGEQETNFFGFYHLVRGTVAKIQAATTLLEMSQIVVQEVQALTGYDRVMVYQFDATGAGQVIAEVKRPEMSTFLGLRYPASDIPKQANQLYRLNWLRLIANVDYQPVPLLPVNHPSHGRPTDLSLSVLRSVSPLHLEYLNNMRVGASMSISLLKNTQLWGLIACHHNSPRYLSYEVRTACEFIGRVVSLELANKEANQDRDYQIKQKAILSRFIETIPQQEDLVAGLTAYPQDLLDLVSATGAVICWNQEWTSIGQTPRESELAALLDWLETQMQGNLLTTDALPDRYGAASDYKQVASGVIALAIARVQRNYILWFRPEVIQTVNWGGNPNKPVEVEADGSLRLSPRKSFAKWQETVQGQSLPWKSCEVEAVLELRSAIVSIVLRRVDELAKMNLELERSNSELDAFAYIASHDLKEPLRGIHNYASFLIEDYADVLDQEGVEKLQTLMRLTQRMEDLINSLLHFSRLGRIELTLQRTDLNHLVQNVLDVLSLSFRTADVEIRIPRPLPTIRCDRVQVNELFSNLISNAVKYNDRPHKWVEIGYLDTPQTRTHSPEDQESDELPTVFYVRDNGVGIRERHLDNIFRIFKRLHGPQQYGGGTGAGLTIAKKIAERHGGRIWVESTYGEGSTFYFTLQA